MPKGKKAKSLDHKRHLKLQREKKLKRKEKRSGKLPAEFNKSKK